LSTSGRGARAGVKAAFVTHAPPEQGRYHSFLALHPTLDGPHFIVIVGVHVAQSMDTVALVKSRAKTPVPGPVQACDGAWHHVAFGAVARDVKALQVGDARRVRDVQAHE
jgi:hypothetical protein